MDHKSVDLSVIEYNSYADYLKSFSTKSDLKYLGGHKAASIIAKLGYRSSRLPYDETEFLRRVDLAKQAFRPKVADVKHFSMYMSKDNKDPVLQQFKDRELKIFSKDLATIVFTSCVDTEGSEISSYLDLGMSYMNARRNALRHTNWPGIYEGTSLLVPMAHHLSYINRRHNLVLYTNSDNFRIVHDRRFGLMFMHKGDHYLISVGGSQNKYSKNAKRSMYHSPKYGTMIFYDHIVRKKV